MKKFNTSIILSFVLCLLMSLACFDAKCDDIRTRVLRLHILANSDSTYDQEVKFRVRDRILEECGYLFGETDDVDGAIEQAGLNLDRLQASAQSELDRLGCGYGVTVELAPTDFDTRDYGDVTLPAGEYMAVRVLIGEAKGANWWCVCFPNMCIPSASQTDEIGGVLSKDETKIVTSSDKYVMRFKTVELYQKLRARLVEHRD